jgi:hypothetical protein
MDSAALPKTLRAGAGKSASITAVPHAATSSIEANRAPSRVSERCGAPSGYFPPPRCHPRPSEMLNDGTYRCVTVG